MGVKCKNCSYAWKCKSDLDNVTCPNCGKKTPNRGEQDVGEVY